MNSFSCCRCPLIESRINWAPCDDAGCRGSWPALDGVLTVGQTPQDVSCRPIGSDEVAEDALGLRSSGAGESAKSDSSKRAGLEIDPPTFETKAAMSSDRCSIETLRLVLRDQHQQRKRVSDCERREFSAQSEGDEVVPTFARLSELALQ